MFDLSAFLREDARLRRLYWRLRVLLVLLPWYLRVPISREPQRCRPGTSHFLAHALAAVLTTGCASLPPDVARPRSEALSPMADTHLAQVVRASPPRRKTRPGRASRLLPDGDHALDARLALARRAQLSLDIQYYQIAADESARRFLRALRDAAARGVRVRLLVDDLNTQPSRVPLAHLSQLNPDFDDFSGVKRRKCLMRIGVTRQNACGGDLGPWHAGEGFLNCARMFLRCNRRLKDGKTHEYWSVVENRRLADGRVVQRQVLYLGEINASQREAWRKTIEVHDEGTRRQVALFPAGSMPADDANAVGIRLNRTAPGTPAPWGACWLSCVLWQQLELDAFWSARLAPSREGTPWLQVLQTLVAYRLIDPGSEWRLHRHWFDASAMADLLHADFALAEKNTLYRCLDSSRRTRTNCSSSCAGAGASCSARSSTCCCTT